MPNDKNEQLSKENLMHKSDCSINNMPAYPNGECDCEIRSEQ